MRDLRLVSLCPSTTATLFDLGLGPAVVGRTRFCSRPADQVSAVPSVGGTKNPQLRHIARLTPSHIFFNREENNLRHLPQLQALAEVIVTTPVDIPSTLDMLTLFGERLGVVEAAQTWVEKITQAVTAIRSQPRPTFRYLYFIWHQPLMAAGAGTYISALLALFGGRNAAAEYSPARYPRLTPQVAADLGVDVAFLSSEPYPYTMAHLSDYAYAGRQVRLIDGEMLSWHGTPTLQGLAYLTAYLTAQPGLTA